MNALELSQLTDDARKELFFWRTELTPLLALTRGKVEAVKRLAAKINTSTATIYRKLDAARQGQWAKVVDRRGLGPAAWKTTRRIGLSQTDRELVKLYCERFQRDTSTDAALDALLRDWRQGKIVTDTPLDLRTGYPVGWSKRNLRNYQPEAFEKKAVRIGRSAAASERRLVYNTRRHLWVGSHYLFDDMWHDHFVNDLDQLKSGRPLEFHALDLYSAKKFAWGIMTRTEDEVTGRMQQLKEADMRFLLAFVLGGVGYSPRGTALVVEEGTATVRELLEELILAESGGLVTVHRNGMQNAVTHAGQYAGRSKGNFRFKAALESLGNPIHNEMAYLVGQTGKDIDHRPEQLHGLLKANDGLLMAVRQLSPERAGMLLWDLLTIQQFRVIANEIYTRMNAREEHNLEGWDMLYVPCRRTGKMRRLSPTEVFAAGQGDLLRLPSHAVAMILGPDLAIERTVRKAMVELRDGSISGDLLRFDASTLSNGEKYATVLNPYNPTELFCYDAKGRFVSVCPRIESVDRADIEAVQRAMGEAAKEESRLLAPIRRRHHAEARERLARMKHNHAVISGKPMTLEEKAEAAQEAKRQQSAAAFGRLVGNDEPVFTPEPATPADIVDLTDPD